MTKPGVAETMFVEDFSNDPQSRWTYVADTVMGGVSKGRIDFSDENGTTFVTLTGSVSTENNGGFVQVRTRFKPYKNTTADRVTIRARGNGKTYYVFLRSIKATRPWHSYRVSFAARENWQIFSFPMSSFKPSHKELPEQIQASDIHGLSLVAYGADYEADLSVSEVRID